MVEYKVHFTISAEALFSILSKFIPVNNLHIEETLAPSPPPEAPRAPSRIAQLVAHKQHKKRKPWRALSPEEGINGIILASLRVEPRTVVQLREPIVAGGYSPNSIGSRMASLRSHGLIAPIGDGRWGLTKQSLVNPQEEST